VRNDEENKLTMAEMMKKDDKIDNQDDNHDG
jgi:hypothetical protein